ncbi:MAG: NUDIX hydrolase [Myxococcota bacterium]|jgi:8-oxo-dGTP pyrophosphatase MutT (NUDIX family)|nr:NUDIX hydrolase [Myxococcota bacterium]
MKIKPWETLSNVTLIEAPIFSVGKYARRHPDKNTEADFWWVSPPDWVNILAITPEDGIVLVRQYRHGTDEITLEIPGGAVDPGESMPEAAARELREETGYTCAYWEQIGQIDVNPAFMTNRCTTFLGVNATLTDDTDFDEHEELSVEIYPVEYFFDMIDKGEIDHGIVVSAAYFLQRWRARNRK